MKAFLKKLWTEISNHNRYKVIAVLACAGLLIYCKGCTVKCNSILHPGTKITGEQLQTEVDWFYAQAELEANSIAKEQIMRQYLWDAAIQTLSTGSFNWLNFFTGAGTLIGFGALGDNIRYRIKYPQKPVA
jgi:hypothetical protein